jgi:RNA polymerase sigma factor (sigma-70 family)
MELGLHALGILGLAGPALESVTDARRLRRGVSEEAAGITSWGVRGYERRVVGEEECDASLAQDVLRGRQDAFDVLVERYKEAVQKLAYRMLGNVTEAEDVTQEVFVRAYTHLALYKPSYRFGSWLLSITSHLCIDLLRRRRFLALPLGEIPFIEGLLDLGANPEQAVLEGEEHEEIQVYVRRLPGKYSAVIVWR